MNLSLSKVSEFELKCNLVEGDFVI
jgi:hypothetical protein